MLGVILAFASCGMLYAAPSLPITEPPVGSSDLDGPDIDPGSIMGQWFTNLTSGAEEVRSHEFHDNAFGEGGGASGAASIVGKVISISYAGSPGISDIIDFEIEATIINDTDSVTGTPSPGFNSHDEVRSIIPEYVGTMVDTKLTADFAVADISMLPIGIYPYKDPFPEVYIVAENEDQWAWYCWNAEADSVSASTVGAYQVPAWDFGDIPPGGGAAIEILRFSVFNTSGGGLPTGDPRYSVLVASEATGADLFANRSSSLKISDWVDILHYDDGTEYPDASDSSSDVSVFHNEEQFDWGDAPDGTATIYPTLAINLGAFHRITPGAAILGPVIDADPDGQPTAIADGDDTDGTDDEDGVALPAFLVPGSVAKVAVTASADGSLLQAWVDFSADGDWIDPGEQIFMDVPLSAGVNVLAFPVPAGAAFGTTFCRFRLSTDPGVPVDGGPAPDGEVEDYPIFIEESIPTEDEFDWGDAPDSTAAPVYPTLAIHGGAAHLFDPTKAILGALIDTELDGQPTISADGDDTIGVDDEDGVSFTTPLIPGMTGTVDVAASAAGSFLDAWIDFDKDGSWTPAEQIIFSDAHPGGLKTYSFFVPPTGSLTGMTTYARFRLSSIGGLAVTGVAPDGEVEDERVFIQAAEVDWGDAPDSYQTLAASTGAYHIVSTGLYFGASIDAEADGFPSIDADGDDLDNINDEDGITLAPIISGTTGTVTYTIGGSGAGFVDGWIDFDKNGTFDPGDQILTNYPVVAPGAGFVNFSVPAPTALGDSYARFRISVAGSLPPYGGALDGEVEDYKVTLCQPIPVPGTVITNISINATTDVSTVEWNAQSNITYQMQCSTNLLTNVWVDVGPYVIGPINWQTNSMIHSNQFYRICVPYAK